MSWLLATVSALLAIAAYPRVGWWPLVFVAHAPLIVALDGKGARARFLHGWLTGTVFTLGMQYWIAGTLVRMSGFGWLAAGASLLLYSAYVGLLHAFFALGYGPVRRLGGRLGWLATVPLLYAVVERGFPVLFPFFLCSPLFEAPVLLQASEIVGPSGMTWLVMLPACALVHVVEDLSRGRASDYFVPTAVAGLWLMVSVWGVVRMQQVTSAPVRAAPTVALVQPNVTVAEKRAGDPSVREGVYERTVAMTRSAMALRPDVLVWPEGGFPFQFLLEAPSRAEGQPSDRNARYSRDLYRLALDLGVDFVAGGLRRQDGRIRNSAMHFRPGTVRAQVYDKRELLLFGERVPFADTFPSLREAVQGMSHYVAGEDFAAFEAAGFRFVPAICYETILPGFTRDSLNQAGRGDVILNLTNDVWFGDTAAAEQHLMVQTQRVIENRVWLVRSTNSGISAFVDPTGTIRAQTPVDRASVLARSIEIPALGDSFYRAHGDIVFHAGCLLALLWMAARNHERLAKLLRRRSVEHGGRAAADPGSAEERGS